MPLSKDTGDRRRVAELSNKLRVVRKMSSAPTIGQLKDGEGAIVTGTGELYYRDGARLYRYTGTLVE